MEVTWAEYGEWAEDVDSHTRQTYEKALRDLQTLIPFEEELMTAEGTKLEAFKNYLKHELKSKAHPARIQCLFERALLPNCLVADVWVRYGKYMDDVLRVPQLVLSVYERAVRNCPWSVTLWLRYCRALERHPPRDHSAIVDIFEKCLVPAFFNQADDYLQMWTGYIDYMRRRIDFHKEHEAELADLRGVFLRAMEFLESNYTGTEGDPTCSIPQYWARIEAKLCSNMEKARELWGGIMQHGFGNQAQMWLEYFSLERAYGDHKHCRKILGRALNSVTDWPEYIVDAYIMYEREEGSLEQLDQAMERCDAQMKRIEERKAAVPSQEYGITSHERSAGTGEKSTATVETQKKTVTTSKGTKDSLSKTDSSLEYVEASCGKSKESQKSHKKKKEKSRRKSKETLYDAKEGKSKRSKHADESVGSREHSGAKEKRQKKEKSQGKEKKKKSKKNKIGVSSEAKVELAHLKHENEDKEDDSKNVSELNVYGHKIEGHVDNNDKQGSERLKETVDEDQNDLEKDKGQMNEECSKQSKDVFSSLASVDTSYGEWYGVQHLNITLSRFENSRHSNSSGNGLLCMSQPNSKSNVKAELECKYTPEKGDNTVASSDMRVTTQSMPFSIAIRKLRKAKSRLKRFFAEVSELYVKEINLLRVSKKKSAQRRASLEKKEQEMKDVNENSLVKNENKAIGDKTMDTSTKRKIKIRRKSDTPFSSPPTPGNENMHKSEDRFKSDECERKVELKEKSSSNVKETSSKSDMTPNLSLRRVVRTTNSEQKSLLDITGDEPTNQNVSCARSVEVAGFAPRTIVNTMFKTEYKPDYKHKNGDSTNETVSERKQTVSLKNRFAVLQSEGSDDSHQRTVKTAKHDKESHEEHAYDKQKSTESVFKRNNSSERNITVNKFDEISQTKRKSSDSTASDCDNDGTVFKEEIPSPSLSKKRGSGRDSSSCSSSESSSERDRHVETKKNVENPRKRSSRRRSLRSESRHDSEPKQRKRSRSPRKRSLGHSDKHRSSRSSRRRSRDDSMEKRFERREVATRKGHKKSRKSKHRSSKKRVTSSENSDSDCSKSEDSDRRDIKHKSRDTKHKSRDTLPKQYHRGSSSSSLGESGLSEKEKRTRSKAREKSDYKWKSGRDSSSNTEDSSDIPYNDRSYSRRSKERSRERRFRDRSSERRSRDQSRPRHEQRRSYQERNDNDSNYRSSRKNISTSSRESSRDRSLDTSTDHDGTDKYQRRRSSRSDVPIMDLRRKLVTKRHRTLHSQSDESFCQDRTQDRACERSGSREQLTIHPESHKRSSSNSRTRDRSSLGDECHGSTEHGRRASRERYNYDAADYSQYGTPQVPSRVPTQQHVPWSNKRYDRRESQQGPYGMKRKMSGDFHTDSPLFKRSRSMTSFCSLCRSTEHETLQDNCSARAEKPHTHITAFKGKDCVFSNFFPCFIPYQNQNFTSIEHAYQFMKCVINDRADLAEQIPNISGSLEVKRLVKGMALNQRWEAEKEAIMLNLIRIKAQQNPRYYEALKHSKELIVEAVPFDRYWSAGLAEAELLVTKMNFWPGKNRMGKLHMRLRQELLGF